MTKVHVLGDGIVKDEKERDEKILSKSAWETGTEENIMCKSIYHSCYVRYHIQSGGQEHRYEVNQTLSGKSYP